MTKRSFAPRKRRQFSPHCESIIDIGNDFSLTCERAIFKGQGTESMIMMVHRTYQPQRRGALCPTGMKAAAGMPLRCWSDTGP